MSTDPLGGFRAALCMSAILTLGVVAGWTWRVSAKLEQALGSVQAIEINTVRLEAEASGLLNASRQVVLTERQASDAQIKQIGQIGAQTTALIKHADETLGDLDDAAKQTLAGAAVDEQQLAGLLSQTTGSIQEATQRSNTLLDNAAQVLDATDTHAAMSNIVTATDNVQKATADAASAMATVRKGVEYEVAQLMKPVRKVKVAGEEAVRLLGRFLGY